MDNDPASMTAPMSEKVNGTSYDIICAADLIPPRRAYLLLDDHPAISSEIMVKDVMATI